MTSPIPRAESLTRASVRFARLLRDRGLLVTPAETLEAARALAVIDITDRFELRLTLRIALTSSPEELPLFDDAFDAFWREELDPSPGSSRPRRLDVPAPPAPISLQRWMHQGAEPREAESAALLAPSAQEMLATKSFAAFTDSDMAALRRVAALIARRLARRPSRRWRRAPRGGRVHVRRTMRQSLRTGGELTELFFRERKMRRTKLIAICDVSGSMDLYSRFLLQFLHALQNSFASVESYVFATRITRVTRQLRGETYDDSLAQLSREVRDWSGGTRIGESLAEFVERWGRSVDRRTVVIILSDGWDTGNPETLAIAMARLRRRAGRIIWLNPLMASSGYEPLTRGMRAALPLVDVLAPVHDLATLRALANHLTL